MMLDSPISRNIGNFEILWDAGGQGSRASAVLREALTASQFVARPLSWVARSGSLFLKVPRRSNSLQADLASREACAEAEQERRVLSALASRSSAVIAPLAQIDACLTMPLLRLDDAKAVLIGASNTHRSEIVAECMNCLVAFHRPGDIAIPVVKAANYSVDRRYPADAATATRVAVLPVVPVIRGFEIRNFFVDQADGRVRFADPHEVVAGVAEEDIARFVVSLLMVRWGRRPSRVWTAFNLALALEAYERGGRPLDVPVLRFMMDFNIAVRERHAQEQLENIPRTVRPLAASYVRWFFNAARNWSRRNGI